ncbi:MAG: dihydroorotate dehydrogenase [Clostridiales bacterium]|nr:dihydroorotate dehydrogenase [Clostridiales bacterium]
MSDRLKTTLFGVEMKNPVIAASGTFGFGREYAELFDISRLGGISGKGLTLHGGPGNQGIRVWETPSGIMNSIGLENPGVDAFVATECDYMRQSGAAVVANLGGHSKEDYLEGAARLNEADVDILELNISCPNVKAGGMAFGMIPETAEEITRAVKEVTRFPLLVKLSPNASDIVGVAKAVEAGGADGVSLVNTFLGMAIDINKRKAVFNNVYAGVSGPAIRPIALRMVHQVAKAVKIPVVGLGGIATAEDAISFIMAGAAAIQVGTMTLASPKVILDIIDGMEAWCEKEGIANIQEIRGII